MSLKIKLISCISLFMLMIGVLIIGVFAATQTINLKGNVEFNVSDTTLYVKDIRLQTETTGTAETIENFMPGYTNTAFDLNLGTVTSSSGSINVYFDFVNTTSTAYSATASGGSGVVLSTSGTIEGSEVPITDLPTYDGISGTITLTIQFTGGTSGSVSLDGIVVTIDEYVPAAVQVTSVSASGATTDTYNGLAGGVAIDGSLDLSGIEFATGETTLTVSMTSLNANYIKNIVSYDSGTVDYSTKGTSGTLFVHSTSLYLPQNSSGELTSGESKGLTIYVNNNTSSAITISGLKVSFEEKENLLQKDTENKYWYVEMGTVMRETESEYIRWKYIASVDDSSGSDVATKYTTFDADSAPTGKGYFYLETNVLSAIGRDGTNNMIEVLFNNDYTYAGNTGNYHNLHGFTNVEANDYATSNVRQYINGNDAYDSSTYSNSIYTPSGRLSNMYTDLNINTEDAVFEKIVARTIGELYKNNKDSSSGGEITFPDLSGADEGYQYQKTDEDAFWLLSYYEVYQLTGGSSTTSSDSGRVWPTDLVNIYWLRSPDSSYSHIACGVSTSGGLAYGNVDYSLIAARSAFKFSI